MRASRKFRTARRVSVVAGVSTAMLLGGLPAVADDAEGRIDRDGEVSGFNVNLGDGHRSIQTNLFSLDLAGGNSVKAYCVEINVSIDPKRSLREQPWDSFPNESSPFHENRDQINWVLHHGYPGVSTDALAEAVGTELNDGLSEREAISATQAAVWHYSDGTDLNKKKPLPKNDDEGAAADVVAVYEYLTGDANTGIGDQPAPALEITPETLEGTAGERLGPFKVDSTGKITDAKAELPDGVKVTDAEGNELSEGATEFYVDVPADAPAGEANFSITVSAHLDTGRLFVSDDYDKKPAQSLIVASSEKTELTETVSASWKAAPAPPETSETTPPAPSETTTQPAPPTETDVTPQAESGDLAETGVSILTPILVGAGLLLAGAALVLLQRRRKNA